MKILAIGKEVVGTDWSTVSKDILTQEARDVYRLYLSEHLREHYFTENKQAVLVLECDSKAHAQALLSKLPLVANNLISFDIVELHPYTGYDRIMEGV